MREQYFFRLALLFLALFLPCIVVAQSSSGGNYQISHSVVAGAASPQTTGGTYTLDGTVGQASAGTLSFNGTYNVRSGFWAYTSSGPTASNVFLSGQVITINGEAIRGARVILTDTFTNVSRKVVTNKKGRFLFDNLMVTHFYILTVKSKQYTFSPDNYTLEMTGNSDGVNFIGQLQD